MMTFMSSAQFDMQDRDQKALMIEHSFMIELSNIGMYYPIEGNNP